VHFNVLGKELALGTYRCETADLSSFNGHCWRTIGQESVSRDLVTFQSTSGKDNPNLALFGGGGATWRPNGHITEPAIYHGATNAK
jgi:hypothetical protein